MDNNEQTDLSYLRELSMGDDSIVVETIETFLEDAPNTLENIKESLEKKDWDRLYKQAHKIKPNLKYMGMERGSELILDIEQKAKAGKISDGLEEQVREFDELCRCAFKELSDKVERLKK